MRRVQGRTWGGCTTLRLFAKGLHSQINYNWWSSQKWTTNTSKMVNWKKHRDKSTTGGHSKEAEGDFTFHCVRCNRIPSSHFHHLPLFDKLFKMAGHPKYRFVWGANNYHCISNPISSFSLMTYNSTAWLSTAFILLKMMDKMMVTYNSPKMNCGDWLYQDSVDQEKELNNCWLFKIGWNIYELDLKLPEIFSGSRLQWFMVFGVSRSLGYFSTLFDQVCPTKVCQRQVHHSHLIKKKHVKTNVKLVANANQKRCKKMLLRKRCKEKMWN